MKNIVIYKLIICFSLILILAACGSNKNPYDISDDTLDQVQTRVADVFMPKSIIDNYKKEDIIITNICKAEHPFEYDNVDYIFQFKTADDEYEHEVAIYKDDNKVGTGGQYKEIEGTCKPVNYQ